MSEVSHNPMSETFDDLFGSSDEEQITQITSHAPLATTTPTPTTTTTQMDDFDQLFPDDDDDDAKDDETQPKPRLHNEPMGYADDADDDDDGGYNTTALPPSSAAGSSGTEASAQPQAKSLTKALGQPEHFYIQRDDPNRSQIEREFTLLTIPKVVGVDYTPYDPLTFDHSKVLESLPPFQREYTQGIESMIRWRVVRDPVSGEEREVSNSRVVHWENGDIHLQVGRQYFPLSVKNERIGANESVDHLFIQSNGLYFHVGNIVSSWKTSIAPHKLSEYGPRMNAVKSRLIELDKERKLQQHFQDASTTTGNSHIAKTSHDRTALKRELKSNNYEDDDDDEDE